MYAFFEVIVRKRHVSLMPPPSARLLLQRLKRKLCRAPERVVHRVHGLRRAAKRRAHRLPVDVLLREQPAHQRDARLHYRKLPRKCRYHYPQLLSLPAEYGRALGVALGCKPQHLGRERRDLGLRRAMVGKLNYPVRIRRAGSAQHRVVQRAPRRSAVLAAHRQRQRVTPDGVAAAAVVDQVPPTADARKAPVFIDAAAYRPRSGDEYPARAGDRAAQGDLMAAQRRWRS